MADIIVVAIMVISLVIGYKRGFLKSVSKLFCWIIAIVVAKFLNPTVSQFVAKSFIGEFIKQKFSETSRSLLPENIPQFIVGTGEGIAVELADVLMTLVVVFNIGECQEMIDKSIIAYTMYRHNVFIDFIL